MKPDTTTISTKRYMNNILDEVDDGVLDLINVEFIAYTTCRDMVQRCQNEDIEIVNATHDVELMITFWRGYWKGVSE